MILGAVLLVAGWAKWLEPGAFAQEIGREGLDFLFSAEMVAVLALGLEVGLGLILVLGARHWTVLAPSTLLVVFFVFLTGRNYWLVAQGLRDPSESCGCFGSLWERTPAEAFWLDLLLLVPALALAFLGRRPRRATPWKRLAIGLTAALAVGVATWNSSDIRFSKVAGEIAAAPADTAFRESPAYVLQFEAAEAPGGKVYQSEGSIEILLDAPQLPHSVLIDPRTGKFHRVERARLTAGENGALLIPDSDDLPTLGDFSIGPRGIQFEVEGKQWSLTPR